MQNTQLGSEKKIYLTKADCQELKRLLDSPSLQTSLSEELRDLRAELKRAVIMDQSLLPDHVVTMNSIVRLEDADTGSERILELVYPEKADLQKGRISIFSPIGTALLGYRTGDTIEWRVPSGTKRLHIKEVMYQPEAKGIGSENSIA